MDSFLVVLVLVGLAVWAFYAAAKASRRQRQQGLPAASARPADRPRGVAPPAYPYPAVRNAARQPQPAPVHVAPQPSGTPVEPWIRGWNQVEVVGENYRDPDIFVRIVGMPIYNQGGSEVDYPAALVEDAGNPHDTNAVAVYVRGEHVGYLDRASAVRYRPDVAELNRRGQHLVIPARTWARADNHRVYARVTLTMPDPGALFPVNTIPVDGHVILPPGVTIQVTREEDHMGSIEAWLQHPQPCPIAVTLHPVTEQRPRSSFDTVEIRLDSERVGILTPTQAANMLPLVKHLTDRGLTPVARATLTGSHLKAEIVLNTARAQDVSQQWLATLG